jgi:hypothetical protein
MMQYFGYLWQFDSVRVSHQLSTGGGVGSTCQKGVQLVANRVSVRDIRQQSDLLVRGLWSMNRQLPLLDLAQGIRRDIDLHLRVSHQDTGTVAKDSDRREGQIRRSQAAHRDQFMDQNDEQRVDQANGTRAEERANGARSVIQVLAVMRHRPLTRRYCSTSTTCVRGGGIWPQARSR